MKNQMKNLKRIIIISIIAILFITVNCVFATDTTEIENYIKENNVKKIISAKFNVLLRTLKQIEYGMFFILQKKL